LSNHLLKHPQKITKISHDADSLLVPLTKSKKLAAIRARTLTKQSNTKINFENNSLRSPTFNKERKTLLEAARNQINTRINEILTSYPPGKQNRMFTIRYGSPESIKQMNLNVIFSRLKIAKPKNFALIENLDYFGNVVEDEKTRCQPLSDRIDNA
jgi:hypothetical protein